MLETKLETLNNFAGLDLQKMSKQTNKQILLLLSVQRLKYNLLFWLWFIDFISLCVWHRSIGSTKTDLCIPNDDDTLISWHIYCVLLLLCRCHRCLIRLRSSLFMFLLLCACLLALVQTT